MKLALTKSQLAVLEDKRGQLDVESGKVLKRLVGRLNQVTGKYEVEVELVDAGADASQLVKFRLSRFEEAYVDEPAPAAVQAVEAPAVEEAAAQV